MLTSITHELPHDIELEQSIIGAAIADNAVMDRIADVQPADFFDPLHAALFAAMREQWNSTRAINIATLRGVLQGMPNITDAVSPAEYVRRLATFGDTRNAQALSQELRAWANRRQMCVVAMELDTAARHHAASILDTANATVQAMDTILSTARGKRRTRSSAGDAFSNFMDRALNDDSSERITTGLASLDKQIGGWRRKQFAILAGRPSMGKTAVATSAMLRTAKAGCGVLFFSLEMSTDSLAARCLTDLTWSPDRSVAYSDVLAGAANDRDLILIGEAAARFRSLPLVIDDQSGLTMAEIGARTRAEAQRFERDGKRLGLVVVDHLGLIKASGRYSGNKVHEVGEISGALASLAKEQDVAVLALHQLNRGTEGRENKRPTLADLRNSGDLEQDADVVCFAFRESYYLERMKCDAGSIEEIKRESDLEHCRNTLEILIAKNRNGATNSVPFFCHMPSNTVRDAA